MHWTVEEFDQSRAQSTLQVAGYETDFLCLVNINTLLRLPRKEVFAHLPHQKVQWPFLLLPNGLLPVRWCFGKITPWSIR